MNTKYLLAVGAIVTSLTLGACGNSNSESDHANHKDKQQEDSNTHVYKNGKVIVIGIQLYKDREKMYYFAYEIKDGKAEINREIDPIKYMKDHKADYEDENVEVEKN